MKLALFGATGNIGRAIAQEALAQGHEVTAIVRDPARLELEAPNLSVVTGDLFNVDEVARAVAGHEAVISAYGPGQSGNPQTVVDAARALLDGVKRGGVSRLLVVGGAGSLEVAPGVTLLDAPQFPPELKPIAQAHSDALAVYRDEADLEWTYLSPPMFITPGERTGHYRLGTDQLVTDDQGNSRISNEDYAIALLDEAATPQHVRQRFTVAY